jgi:hypothetical protein
VEAPEAVEHKETVVLELPIKDLEVAILPLVKSEVRVEVLAVQEQTMRETVE